MLIHTPEHQTSEMPPAPADWREHTADMSWDDGRVERTPATAAVARTPLVVWILAIPLLLLGFGWTVRVQQQLPQIHRSTSPTAAVLGPGSHPPDAQGIVSSPGWYWQVFGSSRSLVSSTSGSALDLRFYGTEVILTARIGPESGRIYVLVDGAPAPGLSQDEHGSYISLEGAQAEDTPLVLTRSLAYQEHRLQLVAAGPGSVAISRLQVVAQPPFPWAFTILELTVATALFAVLRAVANRATGATGSRRSARARRIG